LISIERFAQLLSFAELDDPDRSSEIADAIHQQTAGPIRAIDREEGSADLLADTPIVHGPSISACWGSQDHTNLWLWKHSKNPV
jgi:hypothetical protein